MIFLHYPKCSTCKNAKRLLNKNEITYEERDIKENNPTFEEIKDWHIKSDLPIKTFFNTSGIIYKEMNLKNKISQMTNEECYKLLSTNGMLVKRPILVGNNTIIVGFNKNNSNQWESINETT